jgi:AcrR family transcriptional regulator
MESSRIGKGTQLSLEYLAILESRLRVSWESDEPVCLSDVPHDDIVDLRGELLQLLQGELASIAIDEAKAYGREHVQTVGFGIPSDFDTFAKLGFLYGERLILWDVISSRVLAAEEAIGRGPAVAAIACNFLRLRGAIERGGAVILPHPLTWSNAARHAAEEMRGSSRPSVPHVGLTMAFAAISDGLSVHPYTHLHSADQPSSQLGLADDELYSKDNFVFQQALARLISEERLAYLDNIAPSDFQRIVAKDPFLRVALRKLLTIPSGLSAAQIAEELSQRTEELSECIPRHNKAVVNAGVEAGATSIAFAASTVAALSGQTIGTLSMAGIGAQLIVAIRKWLNVPGRSIIVQTFRQIKAETLRSPLRKPLTLPVDFASHEEALDDDTREALARFRSEDWTEDRHKFLMTLPEDVAGKVMRALTPDDLHDTVNRRRYQEDYIGDYLEDVFDIDREVFWEHVGKSFESTEGLLIYDSHNLVSFMSSEPMPVSVWERLLNCMVKAHLTGLATATSTYEAEIFSEVIRYQTAHVERGAEKREALRSWLVTLEGESRSAVLQFLASVFGGQLPPWVEQNPTTARESSGGV